MRTRPDRPWAPPSLLYSGHRVYFPGVKRPGRGVDHPPPSSAEVTETVELYFFSSPLYRDTGSCMFLCNGGLCTVLEMSMNAVYHGLRTSDMHVFS